MNDPADFALLCETHRDLAFQTHVQPARYLFRWPEGPKVFAFWRTMWRFMFCGVGGLTFISFTAICGWLVWQGGQNGPYWAFGCFLLACMLFAVAGNIALLLTGNGHLIGSKRQVVYIREPVR